VSTGETWKAIAERSRQVLKEGCQVWITVSAITQVRSFADQQTGSRSIMPMHAQNTRTYLIPQLCKNPCVLGDQQAHCSACGEWPQGLVPVDCQEAPGTCHRAQLDCSRHGSRHGFAYRCAASFIFLFCVLARIVHFNLYFSNNDATKAQNLSVSWKACNSLAKQLRVFVPGRWQWASFAPAILVELIWPVSFGVRRVCLVWMPESF